MRNLHPSVVTVAGLLMALTWASAAEAIIVVDSHDQFPFPGSIYQSRGGTTYPNAVFDTEIVSMDLVAIPRPGNSHTLPPPDQTFQIDSFFDVFAKLHVGGGNFNVDSFFDLSYRVRGVRGDTSTRSWDTEMLSMSLSGAVGRSTIVIRESPTLPSLGLHSVTDLGQGRFHVDSFFDVFTELSIDGGPFVPAASPLRMKLTGAVPEPTSAALIVSGILGVFAMRRKARR